ncbi:MAG: hypothetical protein FWG83_04365 [Oscillospiraceae bacterium]|nr:hypothetical protein [Oscillospiraceae bacterium]
MKKRFTAVLIIIPILIFSFSVQASVMQNSCGDVDGNGQISIADALEILKHLAGMSSALGNNTASRNAALVTVASQQANKPVISDVLEILKHLARMNSVLSQHPTNAYCDWCNPSNNNQTTSTTAVTTAAMTRLPGSCIDCGGTDEICEAADCQVCVNCDWAIYGVIRCNGCLQGADCLNKAGKSWCADCFTCEDCCGCGSPPSLTSPGAYVQPLNCAFCKKEGVGCVLCSWCLDCNWEHDSHLNCRECSSCMSCLVVNGIEWCRQCNYSADCCKC